MVIGDVRLPKQVREALRAHLEYEEARVQTYPMRFACPSVVLRDAGTNSGATVFPALGGCGGAGISDSKIAFPFAVSTRPFT